jgi:uncharacterized protein YecE (DUF72 family)
MQRPEYFQQWDRDTPPGFTFAVKGPRFLTHMRKLIGVEQPLSNFFAQGLLALGDKLGPILWQLPPQFRFQPERLAAFFRLLPRTTTEAAILARDHGPRLAGRAFLDTSCHRRIRHAIEIRHPSFDCPEFIALLREHRIGLVIADTVAWPLLFDLTADFVYCRLHGSLELYSSGYEDVPLDTWAGRVAAWARGEDVQDEAPEATPHGHHASPKGPRRRTSRDVYLYFDNDAKVRAPFDAQGLRARVDRLYGQSS